MSQRPELLMVEDTPSLQMVYRAVLHGAGHRVRCAGTAEEGLAAFREMRPPVVLLDLMLPDRDGLDLMREMLELRPDAAVIVITANGSINKAVEAMRDGAYEFLVKRDAAYLQWRYVDCPDKRYRIFAVRKRGTLVGWSVFEARGTRLIWGDALFASRFLESVSLLLRHVLAAYPEPMETVEAWFPEIRSGGATIFNRSVSKPYRSRTV